MPMTIPTANVGDPRTVVLMNPDDAGGDDDPADDGEEFDWSRVMYKWPARPAYTVTFADGTTATVPEADVREKHAYRIADLGGHETTAALVAAERRALPSAAYREAVAVTDILWRAEKRLTRFLRRHPKGCACPYCEYSGAVDHAARLPNHTRRMLVLALRCIEEVGLVLTDSTWRLPAPVVAEPSVGAG